MAKEITPKEKKFKFLRKSARGTKSTVVSIPESKLNEQQLDELYTDYLQHHNALPDVLRSRFMIAVMENLKAAEFTAKQPEANIVVLKPVGEA